MPSSRTVILLALAALLLGTLGTPVQATPLGAAPAPSETTLLAQLARASGGQASIARHAETGKLRFLALDPRHALAPAAALAGAEPEAAARAFLKTYGALFGLRSPDRELTLMQQERIPGRSFVRFQQVYQGVPIMGGELIVQTTDRRAVVSVSGEIQPDLGVSVTPALSAEAARQQALRGVARAYGLSPSQLSSSQPQLWIYNPALLGGPGLRTPRLVWRMELRPADPTVAQPIREVTLVDAQRGVLALHFNQIADAKDRVVCNDNNVIDPDGDQDNNCVAGKYVRVEGQAATGVADVDLAYDYAGITYDYYFGHFGRDSLDGKGLRLISLVKYCPGQDDCPFQNANWDGHQMTYGDGFASADDVVAHELTHGFTEFTSHLFYYYQSGAINESISDVFGELIDMSDGRGNDADSVRWLMGEDLTSLGVIRNMKDPTKLPSGVNGPFFSPSPDATNSQHYTGDTADSGGVHTNSGVNNKAAYLMTDGATFNGVTVSGIGADKVAAIYYTVSTAFLTSASDYQDLGAALGAACDALAGSGAYGIAAADCVQVRNAVLATKMADQPPAAAAPEASICPPGQSTSDLFFDDMERPENGNWASSAATGENVWYYPPVHPLYGEQVYATSGKSNLWGDNPGDPDENGPGITPVDSSIAMTRDISVPAGASMHFRHAFGFEASSFTNYDGGVVEYSTNGGQTWLDAKNLFAENGYPVTLAGDASHALAGRMAFGRVSNGYISSRLNLSPLAGQSVRFRFRIGADEYIPDYGWFIDDMRIYTCSSALPQVGWQSGAAVSVPENAGDVQLQVKLSGTTDKTVTLPVTASGTAVAGSNYLLKTSQVTIAAGQTSATVFVQLINNGVWETDKTLVLTLGTPQNATLGTSQAEVLIQNVNPKLANPVYLPAVTRP